MRQLDYLCLVSNLPRGTTIKLPCYLFTPAGKPSRWQDNLVILDTGADNSAFSEQYLRRVGYTDFAPSGKKKQTGNGIVEIKVSLVQGLVLASKFKVGSVKVDVLSSWDSNKVVGVIGMDILTSLTFVLSHEHKKFMLATGIVPALNQLF